MSEFPFTPENCQATHFLSETKPPTPRIVARIVSGKDDVQARWIRVISYTPVTADCCGVTLWMPEEEEELARSERLPRSEWNAGNEQIRDFVIRILGPAPV